MTDPHIMAVLLAMKTDLEAGSPAGRLYGESLADALAVYLLNRYAVRRYAPIAYRGGLPGYRLRRVLDHIGDSLADDLSSRNLLRFAGMSPHYFAELFSKSMGHAPRRYVLLQRIERAKQSLCEPGRSVIEAGLDVRFQNPSHFARMFRKFVAPVPQDSDRRCSRDGDRIGRYLKLNRPRRASTFPGCAAAPSCLTKNAGCRRAGTGAPR